MKRISTILKAKSFKVAMATFALAWVIICLNSFSLSASEISAAIVDSIETAYELDTRLDLQIDSTSTVDDYLAFAALKSPALRRAFYNWKATLEKSGYAGSLPDPMFSYGYFIKNVETRVGPQNQKFSLRQSFPWFGTLGARKDIANESAMMAFQKYQAEKLRLFYSVRSAYYELYYLGRDIALTNDNLELLKFWESIVRTKYKVALSKHPDLIKTQLELATLEDWLITLQYKTGPMIARLRSITNLADSIVIFIPKMIEINETKLDAKKILDDAFQNNPNLNASLHLIDKEQASVRLSGKSSLPNFSLGLDYIETGDALNPLLDESGKDPWVIGVGINLPIWFGKNNAQKNEARARLQSAQYSHADTKNKIQAKVMTIFFEYTDSMRKINLYRDGLIPKAEQALKASYTSYQSGETDFLYLLDTQRQLLAFQLKFERAITDLATRRAEIEMITGNEINNR